MNEVIKPGKWLYWLAGAIWAVGMAIFVVFLIFNIVNITNKNLQVIAPGKTEVKLDKAGKYTIFYEREGFVNNRLFSMDISKELGLEFKVTDKADNSQIPVSRTKYKSEIHVNNYEAESVLQFTVDKPGTYEISSVYTDGKEGGEVSFVIVHGFASKIITTVIGALAIMFGSTIAAILIAVVTYTKRKKYKREQKYNFQ